MKVNPSITSKTGPKTMRGMPMKAMNRPSACPKASGPLGLGPSASDVSASQLASSKRGQEKFDGDECARRFLDEQLQQKQRRNKTDDTRPQHEYDHIAERDHAGRTLRGFFGHAEFVEGDGSETRDQRKNVAGANPRQPFRRAHALPPLPLLAI